MKKYVLILILSILTIILFILGYHFLLKNNLQKGALQITSSPESKVYLGNKYIGQTPLCKCESTDMLTPGNYIIRLVPVKGKFMEFQEKITVSGGVLTVVDRKFANDSLSEGSVISLTPLKDKKKTELVVVSLPESSSIFLDKNEIGKTPLSFKDPTASDHILLIKKQGYKDKNIRIRTPIGYRLTVTAYLGTVEDLSIAYASQSAVVSPTPTISGQTILILDTPTGFLRVRESINGAEIARATPGEIYEFVSEENSWFEIVLKDGKKGWINSQYAKKN